MNPELSPDNKLRLVAFHEAGHAVAMVAFGLHFEKVSIIPDPTKLGFVECTPGRSSGDAGRLVHNLHEIVCDLAGPIAHGRALWGTPFRIVGSAGVDFSDDRTKASVGCQRIVNDFLLAQSHGGVVSSSGPSPEAKEIEYVLFLAAVAVVESRWSEIEAVANSLLQHREITESQVAGLCASTESAKRNDAPAFW